MTDEQKHEKIIEELENDCTTEDVANYVSELGKKDLTELIGQICNEKKCVEAKNWIIDYLAWIIFYERA